MKKRLKQFYLILLALFVSFLLDSCHSSKKTTKKPDKSSATYTTKNNNTPDTNTPPISRRQRKAKSKNVTSSEVVSKENDIINKYASKLGVSKSDITNYELYNFIDEWYGTPYKYAGRTHAGVDCSDFASLLFQSIYNISISGNVTDIYRRCKPIKQSELQEGDLIFFKINSKSLSHVAIYLQNHKFVHASVHSGVVIDDLGEDYYRRYFWGAGRIIKN